MSNIVTLHYDPVRYNEVIESRGSALTIENNPREEVAAAIERMSRYEPHFTKTENGTVSFDLLGEHQWQKDNQTICNRLAFLKETYKAIQLIKRKGYREAQAAMAYTIAVPQWDESVKISPTPEYQRDEIEQSD